MEVLKKLNVQFYLPEQFHCKYATFLNPLKQLPEMTSDNFWKNKIEGTPILKLATVKRF